MRESSPQAAIIEAIRLEFGADVDVTNNHGSPYSRAGQPDITLCMLGLHISIEVKMPARNGRPAGQSSKIQIARARAIVRAGGTVILAHSAQEALDLLRPIYEGRTLECAN